jgi:UDP-2,3-diacylglucosamine hydrolase
MFSSRSLADRHEEAIYGAARKAHTMVLGGDIFDFRWSTLSNPQATVRAAMQWLDSLVTSHRRTKFHFVLGNHDYNRRFLHALESYSVTSPNLTCHHYYLRLGKSVFLHGDVADKPGMCAESLRMRREHWLHDEVRQPWRHKLYDLAVQARLHQIASKVAHPPRRVANRIVGYLKKIGEGPGEGVRHVYFGHTHESLTDFRLGGVAFHNGGAPMPGLSFRIVETAAAHTR